MAVCWQEGRKFGLSKVVYPDDSDINQVLPGGKLEAKEEVSNRYSAVPDTTAYYLWFIMGYAFQNKKF
ncbi:hypothetical protein SK128_023253 [Halocaridina rubra]|uniref:Uncharacterized protein n=1 Tax=Halocaridina rubra TaxID=373956 RepID=A0AAN8XKN4_HALRR